MRIGRHPAVPDFRIKPLVIVNGATGMLGRGKTERGKDSGSVGTGIEASVRPGTQRVDCLQPTRADRGSARDYW
jgi:hypothetical protein